MQLILKTSNGSITEKPERCDKKKMPDEIDFDAINILSAAMVEKGMNICEKIGMEKIVFLKILEENIRSKWIEKNTH